MRTAIKLSPIFLMVFCLSSAQAMTFATLAHCAKSAFLLTAKKSGTKWMVHLARLTNQGTIKALEGDYQKECVRKYADVLNDSRADLIMKVIKNGDEEGVEFLLDPKECLKCFQGTEQDPTLLHVALRMKQYRAARVLLDLGLDPNASGKAAFSDLVRPLILEFARDIDAVLLLMEFDADLNWHDDEQRSIYADLFEYGAWDVICLLHDRGLKLSCGDYSLALEHKNEIVEFELTSFIRQLKIKRPLVRPNQDDETAPQTSAANNLDGLTATKPTKRQIKDVVTTLNSMSRKEKLMILRDILKTETKTAIESEKE